MRPGELRTDDSFRSFEPLHGATSSVFGDNEVNTPCSIGGASRYSNSHRDHSASEDPLVTVVTVVLNGFDSLERTILSVIGQSYSNVEYIIIDGGSTDGSVEIIKRYEQAIDFWVSESDGGIYYAMNKGIDLAHGEWINFMNCGDVFASQHTIQIVMANTQQGHDLIYGDYYVDLGGRMRLKINGSGVDLWRGLFCHQAMFVSVWFAKLVKFDLSIPINADTDMVLRYIELGLSYKKLDLPLACVQTGGVSDVNRLKSVLSQWRITLRYKPRRSYIIHFHFSILLFRNIVLIMIRFLKRTQ